jgi:hypothetical protein
MGNLLKKVLKFSSLIKVLTIICLVGLILAYLAPFVHPATFKLLPFFGLAYPIILIFTLIFLVIWSLAKSKWALITLGILLLGGKLHFRMIAFGSDKDNVPTEEKVLNVMSYNVRLFDLYSSDSEDRYEKRDSIFNYIVRANPDIICFQETKAQEDQVETALKDFNDYQLFAYSAERKGYSGTAILTKKTPISVYKGIGINIVVHIYFMMVYHYNFNIMVFSFFYFFNRTTTVV